MRYWTLTIAFLLAFTPTALAGGASGKPGPVSASSGLESELAGTPTEEVQLAASVNLAPMEKVIEFMKHMFRTAIDAFSYNAVTYGELTGEATNLNYQNFTTLDPVIQNHAESLSDTRLSEVIKQVIQEKPVIWGRKAYRQKIKTLLLEEAEKKDIPVREIDE